MSRDYLKGKSIQTESEKRERDQQWLPGVGHGNTVTTNGHKGSFWGDGKALKLECDGSSIILYIY